MIRTNSLMMIDGKDIQTLAPFDLCSLQAVRMRLPVTVRQVDWTLWGAEDIDVCRVLQYGTLVWTINGQDLPIAPLDILPYGELPVIRDRSRPDFRSRVCLGEHGVLLWHDASWSIGVRFQDAAGTPKDPIVLQSAVSLRVSLWGQTTHQVEYP